jgi:hypothetical protein
MTKIYISGKITGLPMEEVIEKFNNCEKQLQEEGFITFNPIKISPYSEEKTWEDYMVSDIEALFKCDAIYMMLDWGQSKGARIEYQIAKEMGIQIYFEEITKK